MVLRKAEQRRAVDVAEMFGVGAQTVNGWLWRYKHAGIKGLATPSGPGRRSLLHAAADAAVVRAAVADQRQRIASARAEVEHKVGTRFSDKTLRRFLKTVAADINVAATVLPKRTVKTSTPST